MLKYVRRYKNMILASILFFYLGCGITLNLVKVDCHTSLFSHDNNSPSIFNTIEYAVLVLSSPENKDKRDAIRSTWLKFASNIFIDTSETLLDHTLNKNNMPQRFARVFFAIGIGNLDHAKLTKLKSENDQENDILLLDDFEDNYKNLAQKMKHSLKWLSKNLKNMKYVVKCDDDSFVRIDLIVTNLETYAPNMNAPEISKYVSSKSDESYFRGLYWGYFDGRAKVNYNGKWQEHNWFLCDNYLPYALGGGYVISRSIVDYIAQNADILSHYVSEDVSMGVWTAALSGINRVHDIRFDTEWKSRGCTNELLVRHKQTPSDMYQMYRALVQSRGEKICKTEGLLRKSYLYKWNVHPSMCCK